MNVLLVTDHVPGHDLGFQKSGHAHYLGAILTHFAARGDVVTALVFRPNVDFAALATRDVPYAIAGPAFAAAGSHVLLRSPAALAKLAAWNVFTRLPRPWQAAIDALRRRVRRARKSVHHLGSFLSVAERAHVAAAVQRSKPDLVVYDGIFNSCGRIAGVPTCLIAHEVKHERSASFAEHGVDIAASAVTPEAEAAILREIDTLLAIQWDDADALRALAPDARVVVVPAVVTPPERQNAARPQPGRCVFVGSGSFHNYDGLSWFLETCWPHVRAAVPDATLAVYGSVCYRLENVPAGVTLHGTIDDLAPAYAEADVTLVPLRIGSGLKIKLVEAFAHAQAVVTTPVGAQGLMAFDPRPFVVADANADFAAATIALLSAPAQQRHDLRDAARQCAEAFTPQTAFAGLDAVLA